MRIKSVHLWDDLLPSSCSNFFRPPAPEGRGPRPRPRRPVLTPSNAEPIKTDRYKVSMAYLTNGVPANDEYKGKFVDVSGDAGTSSEEGGEIFVTFNWEAGNPPTVTCYFEQSERADVARLRAGQKMALRCVGAGADKSTIEFRQCRGVN